MKTNKWRVIEGLSPECGLVVTHGPETRLGRRCSADERGRSSIFNQTFQVQGSKLFNSIPKNIRNLTGCGQEEFKEQLDIYLGTLQDQPASPGWIPQGVSEAGTPSNSILHQKERLDRVNEIRRRPPEMSRRKLNPTLNYFNLNLNFSSNFNFDS